MSKILGNLKKITMVSFRKLSIFAGHKSILHHFSIQNVKDGIQIRVCKINKEI